MNNASDTNILCHLSFLKPLHPVLSPREEAFTLSTYNVTYIMPRVMTAYNMRRIYYDHVFSLKDLVRNEEYLPVKQ